MASSFSNTVTAEDWIKGIAFSILASIIGGASKLAIRKSWLMEFDIMAEAASAAPTQHEDESSLAAVASSHVAATKRQISLSLTAPYEMATNGNSKSCKGKEVTLLTLTQQCRQDSRHNCSSNNEEENGVQQPREGQLDGLWRDSRSSNHHHHHDQRDVCPAIVLAQEEEVAEEIRQCCCCCCCCSKNTARTKPPVQPRSSTAWFPWCFRMSGLVGMTFLNPLCCVLAMKYASPSILAPFSGLTLVWIVLLSHMLIGEAPTFPQKIAAALIVAGEVMVAIFGDHTNDEGITVEDVRRSYGQVPFLLYFLAIILWMACVWYWMTNKTTSLFLKQFAWGVSGGSITGLQNFLKDALTIAKAKKQSSSSSTTEDDEGWPWFLILFIFLAIATAFGGLLLLTACMKRYDATYSSAMFVGSFVVSASIMSAVHYRTFQNLKSVWNYVLYPMGLVVLMVGVFILVQETREHSAEDGDDVNLDGANVLPPLSMSPNDLQEQLLGRDDDDDDSDDPTETTLV